MSIVILGGIACMILSFKEGQYVVGVLSALTIIVPSVIWYSDGKDNDKRDQLLERHDDSLTWHEAEISKKANNDQGFYDV